MTIQEILRNGQIPQIGFGPGEMGTHRHAKKKRKGVSLFIYRIMNKFFYRKQHQEWYINSIASAINVGYRLIDYSSSYGDGKLLGEGIRRSGLNREKLFITARITNPAQMKHTVREEFMTFIHNMGIEYVDLLQFHWPVTGVYLDTWKEMEKLYEEGFVKHLGVANCHQHHLDEIFKICKYPPEVGQFEIHPLFTQKPLIDYYKKQGIVVEAYTPIARYDDRLIRLPLLKHLEKKYNKSFIQIILRWHIQNGIIPLVRTMSEEHQKENLDIFDFEIDKSDMMAIDGININSRLRYDPDNCDFSIL